MLKIIVHQVKEKTSNEGVISHVVKRKIVDYQQKKATTSLKMFICEKKYIFFSKI